MNENSKDNIPGTIDISTLKTWSQTLPNLHDLPPTNKNSDISPFPFDETLNNSICLWRGDITYLNATCIVSSTNEQLNDESAVSERLHERAGYQLTNELKRSVKKCLTGSCKLTNAYDLPSVYIAHAVGPRFNNRYRTAAENVLFSCYRNVFECVSDLNMKSVAICCLHSHRRGYPIYDGSHIAIRSVRRYLENCRNIQSFLPKIIFVVNSDEELVYKSMMALYFPRSQNEQEYAQRHMPSDIGNEQGAPIIAERCIRIAGKLNDLDDSIDVSKAFDTSVAVGRHSFSKMTIDVDKKRRSKLGSTCEINEHLRKENKVYERLLLKTKQVDFKDIIASRCLYRSGFDRDGRAVVVFIADNFKYRFIENNKALLYFIHLMDGVSRHEFVFVYFHSALNRTEQPDINFFQILKSHTHTSLIVSLSGYPLSIIIKGRYVKKYSENLTAIYFLHSNIWSKVITWYITRFFASAIRNKVRNIEGLEYLYSRIAIDQLDLPSYIFDNDLKINGARYYDPDKDKLLNSCL